ncbi:MAG: hypothetical protein HY860_00610 [Chlamydiales bacterium]|nr:hypothetical protein [Chlamydiales bacterium]
MKLRYLLPLLFITPLFAIETFQPQIVNQIDLEALREWIATKRQVTIKQLGGDLALSGEVRAEMQTIHETQNGMSQRGPSSPNPNRPVTTYDVEVNLMLDYRTPRTWASIKLEFDNDAGNVTAVFDSLAVERAIFGGRVYETEKFNIIGEVGRNRFAATFDSKIEFGSFMDGIVLKFDYASEGIGDLYVHGGPFLVNEKVAQYGYIMELGLLNIKNSGLYSKYSVIDWDTKNFTDPVQQNRFRFIISQFILGYKLVPKWLDKMVTFYAAGLLNHKAKPLPITNNTKSNYGAYAGLSIGKVRQQGDWSIDFNYQAVASQAVPDYDAGGIGLGNAGGIGFYTVNLNGSGSPQTSPSNVVGRGNYRGISAEILYLLTNNLTIYQTIQHATNLHQNIGPAVNYNLYEVEFIYAF